VRLLLASLLALAVFPAAARGAVVEIVTVDSCAGDLVCEKYSAGVPVAVTRFTGAPGEANRVTVARAGDELVFRELGAPLAAQAPCRSVDSGTARCPVTLAQPGIRGLSLALGDGADEATVTGDPVVETIIRGEAGADTVTGGEENDLIDGGPGADRLAGGGGSDELSYASAATGAKVDLAAGTGVVASEPDTVAGFEVLVGSARADILRGGARDELIDGGDGDDRVHGRGGADLLFGSLGADRLAGGAGDDRLFGDPEQGSTIYERRVRLRADRLAGGPGNDELFDGGGRNVFVGGPGRDVLWGGPGPDALRAGPGRDRVDASAGGRDRVHCGSGRDRAITDRGRDTRRSCELGWRGGRA
jgi:Ca2+-binding RTX toxin-like protein